MGQLRTGLRAYALEGHPPGETLKRLDRLLQTISGRGMATAGYAVVDPATGALRYASAGHPPPVVVRRGQEAHLLEARPAPPLGSLPFAAYHEAQETLEPGDTILLYTDGLVERRREPLTAGLERLRALAAAPPAPRGSASASSSSSCRPREATTTSPSSPCAWPRSRRSSRVRFAADPQILSQMRRTVSRWLQAHGAEPREVAAITLACGEACANAIEHAYAPGVAYFELDAAHDAGVVTITVRDTGRWRAARGTNRGRGLKMIGRGRRRARRPHHRTAGTEVVMRQRLGAP